MEASVVFLVKVEKEVSYNGPGCGASEIGDALGVLWGGCWSF
jgi:hypothetical protein